MGVFNYTVYQGECNKPLPSSPSFPGLLKSSMSILLVQSQDVWWEKFPLFISLKT